ncbi:MAG: hypothetical protein H7230_00355 [Candidatus Parcubacteria bacterium]|nr:hypothetical protein [Candidatus Paceibacterota bacterium]
MPPIIINMVKKYPNELGRKLLHIGSVFFCLGLIQIFNPGGVAFIIAVATLSTFLADTLGYLDFFKNVKRVSYGHYFMAFGIVVTLILYAMHKSDPALVFAFLALGVCDPLAVFGRPIYDYLSGLSQFHWVKKLTYKGKTITGSLIFFVSALVLGILTILFSHSNIDILRLIKLTIAAILLTAIEFWSIWGIDNLTLPVGAFGLYLWVIN